MSLQDIYKNAGVVIKPAAMKDGKLYSQQPHSGAGDFNFSRADGVQTRINKHGLIETVANNEPRLSYDLVDGKVSDCPHLLLEPSRTNNLPYSEQFDNAAWAKGNSTVAANQAISPDGSKTADLLQLTSAGGNVFDGVGGSGDYAFSVFAKYVDAQYIRLRSTGSYAYFDIQNGSVGSTTNVSSTKIEDYGNGWYRCTVVGNNTNSLSQIFVSDTDGSNTGTGSVYIWGAMFESGSYATSYIPTSGSTETRQADICNGSGNSETFNDSEGVLFAEIQAFAEENVNRYIVINDGAGSPYTNSLMIQYRNNGTVRIFHNGTDFADAIHISGASFDQTENHKIAIRYKENDMKVYIDGVSQSLNSSFVYQSISGLNELSFDINGALPFLGKIKQAMTFKTALTDSELEKLTSWESFFDMAKGQEYNVKL